MALRCACALIAATYLCGQNLPPRLTGVNGIIFLRV
jgi:hypothetical protein